MKRKLTHIAGIIGLVIGSIVPTALAQTTAPGPYYATPSWDQTLACATLATCPRFIVLSNFGGQAVLDRETGLVWEQSPSTNDHVWLSAVPHCNGRKVGGRMGWRLPTLHELTTIVDPTSGGNPRLPPGHPFSNVQPSRAYFSATTFVENPVFARVVFTFNGDIGAFVKNQELGLAWCVRGGQGIDPS